MKLTALTLLFGILLQLGAGKTAVADVIGGAQPRSPDLADHLRKAERILQTAGIEEARLYLQEHFEPAQDQPHPDILLTQLLNRNKRPADARRVLESLAREHPERLDVRTVFCELAVRDARWFEGWLHALAAEAAVKPDNWTNQHEENVRRDLLRLKATCCEGRADWGTAEEIYTDLITDLDANAVPQASATLMAQGRCRFHLGRYDQALQSFERAHAIDSQGDAPQQSLAALFDSVGRTDEARDYFQQAVRHPDDKVRARARLAFVRWLLWHNEPQEITELLADDTEYAEQEADRQLLLAMAERMQQQFDEAQERLTVLHRQYPNRFPVSNQLALVLIESADEGRRSRALQIAQANARNHQGRPEAWATLGWVQFRLGDAVSATNSMSRAVGSGQVSRDTAWQLAKIHEHVGNPAKARELSSAALNSQGPFFAAGAAGAGSELPVQSDPP